MRTLPVYLPLILVLFITACKDSPHEPKPEPEEPPSGPIKLLTMQKKYYDPLNAGKELYWTFYENASEKSITMITDSVHNQFVKNFYDNEGRLQKRVRNNYDYTFSLKDTMIFSRPSPGVIKRVSSNGFEKVYTITSLTNGSKQIETSYTGTGVSELYIIDNDSDIVKASYLYPDLNGYESNRHRYFEYDGNKKLIGIKDTIRELGDIAAQHTTIVKDQANNTLLLNLLRKIAGSDMEWVIFADPEPLHTPWFSRRILDFHFIDKGTVSSYLLRRWSAPGGEYFTEYEPFVFNATTVYDGQGRITNNKLYENGKLIETLDIIYPD